MHTHKDRGRAGIADFDFHKSPFVVIWETTRACDLACRHCRAEAVPYRNPNELSTDEAKAMLRKVREFGNVVFVMSGGDCLKRPDVFELVDYGFKLGLRMGVTPATTPLATADAIRDFKNAGLSRLAVSLDGSTPAIHDAFRRVDGSFDWGMRILEECRRIGLSTQVNTVIARHNIDDFDNLAALMERLGIVFWEVFFLVPTGRAKPGDVASAEEYEKIFHKMYDLSKTAPFDIKATAAPQYSRVIMERQVAERRAGSRDETPDVLTGGVMFSLSDGIGRARSVNDGDGFMFISHTGEIMPSGFLPIVAGNIRNDDLLQVYRESPIFTQLRRREDIKGKCGVCEYLKVCGGSRARAYGMTGDFMESEPFCTHIPKKYAAMVERGEAEPVTEYFEARYRRPLPVTDVKAFVSGSAA
ncbi:MAG: TIGR04053 family radical SAM/SPASM domain-containing protein [Gemmatimonadaceae bacterium]